MSQTYHVLQERGMPKLLTIVIPAYNEQEMIPLLRERLTALLDDLPCAAEALFVNDGSTDRTLPMLMEWAAEDSRVKVIGLARNFGHQAAVTAGVDEARGDAVVVMDADLQDPPEVVRRMLDEYCKGYDVVYGRRMTRNGDSAFKRLTAWGFYRFMRRFIHRDLPADCGDFRLMSRACIDSLKSMRETHRFLRGMVAWVGFAQTAVQFERPPRAAGKTKYSLAKMIHFAWVAAISFSPAPLRISLAIGAIAVAIGCAYGVYALARVLLGLYVVPGWTSVIVLICLMGGGILMSIGILGEYIGRIFEEVKDRPLYIVSTRSNSIKESKPVVMVDARLKELSL